MKDQQEILQQVYNHLNEAISFLANESDPELKDIYVEMEKLLKKVEEKLPKKPGEDEDVEIVIELSNLKKKQDSSLPEKLEAGS